METAQWSSTEGAEDRKPGGAHVRIRTPSTKPVAYKISFVSELPEDRVGSIAPGPVARDYMRAVVEGDLREMYRATRTRYTTEQAVAVRVRLFGAKELPAEGLPMAVKDRTADVDARDDLPEQSVIFYSDDAAWAFLVKCQKRDGLWLVKDVRRDTGLTDDELEAIVRRSRETANVPLGPPPFRPIIVWAGLVGAVLVSVAGAAGLIVLRKRRRDRSDH